MSGKKRERLTNSEVPANWYDMSREEQAEIIRGWMSFCGARGGKATGESKVRGNSEYYSNLRAKRTAKEKAAKSSSKS